jgi:hypothetical protein
MHTVTRIGIATLVAASIGAAQPATAVEAAGDPRPRILDVTWVTRPVTSGARELLEIRAVDPDGVISRVNVWWGDDSLTHADLICFDVGEVARVRLDHIYRSPGRYLVRVTAVSSSECFGPSGQNSPEERVPTLVRPKS